MDYFRLTLYRFTLYPNDILKLMHCVVCITVRRLGSCMNCSKLALHKFTLYPIDILMLMHCIACLTIRRLGNCMIC